MKVFAKTVVLAVLLLGVAGCAALKQAQESEVDPDSIQDVQALVDYLSDRVPLIDEGPFTSPEMTTPGRAYMVTSGTQVYVFEFPNGADATSITASIGRDNSGEAYLYQKENLVAFVVGDDARVTRALLRIMGSPRRV